MRRNEGMTDEYGNGNDGYGYDNGWNGAWRWLFSQATKRWSTVLFTLLVLLYFIGDDLID
jgi:hypothetical protein